MRRQNLNIVSIVDFTIISFWELLEKIRELRKNYSRVITNLKM